MVRLRSGIVMMAMVMIMTGTIIHALLLMVFQLDKPRQSLSGGRLRLHFLLHHLMVLAHHLHVFLPHFRRHPFHAFVHERLPLRRHFCTHHFPCISHIGMELFDAPCWFGGLLARPASIAAANTGCNQE